MECSNWKLRRNRVIEFEKNLQKWNIFYMTNSLFSIIWLTACESPQRWRNNFYITSPLRKRWKCSYVWSNVTMVICFFNSIFDSWTQHFVWVICLKTISDGWTDMNDVMNMTLNLWRNEHIMILPWSYAKITHDAHKGNVMS